MNAFQANQRTEVIELTGTLGVSSPVPLDQMIHARLQAGCCNFTIDMARVRHVDSMGIAMLLASASAVRQAGGRMVLAHMNARVRKLLGIVRLLAYFEGTGDAVPAAIDPEPLVV